MTSQQKRNNVKGLDVYVESFTPIEQPSLRKYKQLKRSAGVALEVNRRNLFHASEGSTIILNPRADATRSPKHGYQWSHKKD